MNKGLKFFLFLIGFSYSLALGMWAAKGFHVYENHKKLKYTLIEINSLSKEYKNNLFVLADKIEEQDRNYASLSKHLRALAQIVPEYTLENALVKNEEHQKLEYFVDGMLEVIVKNVPDYPPEETLLFQEHIQSLKKKRVELKSALTLP